LLLLLLLQVVCMLLLLMLLLMRQGRHMLLQVLLQVPRLHEATAVSTVAIVWRGQQLIQPIIAAFSRAVKERRLSTRREAASDAATDRRGNPLSRLLSLLQQQLLLLLCSEAATVR
jgi:hypothetical protein